MDIQKRDLEFLEPVMTYGRNLWYAREAASVLDDDLPSKRALHELTVLVERTVTNEDHRHVYHGLIEQLQKSYAGAGTSMTDLSFVFTWLFEVREEFIALLRIPTQEAVVILAFVAVLLNRIPQQWWGNGWAEHLMHRIYALLDDEYRLWIAWPMEEMGWVPPQLLLTPQ